MQRARFLLFAASLVLLGVPSHAATISNKLALGVTYGGGLVHWGFARKWALEFHGMQGEATGTDGTIKSTVFGLRMMRYFRAPSRLRFYAGLEGASTHSTSDRTEYDTSGFAAGAFGGTEIYLLRRLSVGVDIGPYLLSTNVRRSQTTDGDVTIVINSFMNFYFL